MVEAPLSYNGQGLYQSSTHKENQAIKCGLTIQPKSKIEENNARQPHIFEKDENRAPCLTSVSCNDVRDATRSPNGVRSPGPSIQLGYDDNKHREASSSMALEAMAREVEAVLSPAKGSQEMSASRVPWGAPVATFPALGYRIPVNCRAGRRGGVSASDAEGLKNSDHKKISPIIKMCAESTPWEAPMASFPILETLVPANCNMDRRRGHSDTLKSLSFEEGESSTLERLLEEGMHEARSNLGVQQAPWGEQMHAFPILKTVIPAGCNRRRRGAVIVNPEDALAAAQQDPGRQDDR